MKTLAFALGFLSIAATAGFGQGGGFCPPTYILIASVSPLPSGAVGAAYSQQLMTCGGTAQQYDWQVTSGELPPGLSLSSLGLISGIPTSLGTWTFGITVTNPTPPTTGSGTFTLTINPAPIVIPTTSPLPSGMAGAAYSQTLAATGGVPPYTWKLTSGTLPPLLALSSNGVLSGTATTSGAWNFTVSVTDTASGAVSQTFTLDITLGPLTITSPATLPSGAAGAAYSQTLAASGGAPPYTWQVVSGTWPVGLSLSSGGVISGTPTAAGTYSFSAQVSDSASESAKQSFGLTVTAAGSLSRIGVIPQIAAGGGWTTTLWLINGSAATVQTNVVFHGDNGGPLSLAVNVVQPSATQQSNASTLNLAIAPNTTVVVTTEPLAATVDGWADVLGNGALSGFAVFSNGTTEAAVPLQSQIGTSFRLPFDNTNGASTGVALVNLAGAPANLTATVWDQYGNQLAALPVTLTQNDATGDGHDSFMLPARLAVTAGIRGIVQFVGNAGSPFAAEGQLTGLGLRTEASGLFTSIPTIVP